MYWSRGVQNDTNCFFSQLLCQCQQQHEPESEPDFKKEILSFETDFLGRQDTCKKGQRQMWVWDNNNFCDLNNYEDLMPPHENQLVRVKSLRIQQEHKVTNFLTKEIFNIPIPEKGITILQSVSPRKKKKIDKPKSFMPKHKP